MPDGKSNFGAPIKLSARQSIAAKNFNPKSVTIITENVFISIQIFYRPAFYHLKPIWTGFHLLNKPTGALFINMAFEKINAKREFPALKFPRAKPPARFRRWSSAKGNPSDPKRNFKNRILLIHCGADCFASHKNQKGSAFNKKLDEKKAHDIIYKLWKNIFARPRSSKVKDDMVSVGEWKPPTGALFSREGVPKAAND